MTVIPRKMMKASTRGIPFRFLRHSSSLSIKNFDNEYISVVLDNKRIIEFSNLFLRDSCQDIRSVDPYSKQKLFTTAGIAKNLTLNQPPIIIKNSEGAEDYLQVEWNQKGVIHRSIYPKSFLEKYSSNLMRRKGKYFNNDKVIWNNSIIMNNVENLKVNYGDYLHDDKYFVKTLKNLNAYGLSFIENIPNPSLNSNLQTMNEENSLRWPVAKLASKFSYIKKTFYGTLFDVKIEKKAKNIANTNTFLPLHMDLLYYESPPGLQLLHFIQNSALGGDNIFCDSFLAANYVREVDPQAFDALTKVPITYHYDNNNEYYYYSRPLIVEDKLNADKSLNHPTIKEVNYSPPFQGPFEFGITKNSSNSATNVNNVESDSQNLFNDFVRGFQIFEDYINDPKNQYQVKMKEGTCVIFDNRRVLHSRLGFSDENDGDRWLMGCYVDGDSYRSKLRLAYGDT